MSAPYVTLILIDDRLRQKLSIAEDESFAVIGVDGDRHAMVCLGSEIPADVRPMDYARKLAGDIVDVNDEGLPFYPPRDVFRFSLYRGVWGAVDGEPCRCRDCRLDGMADAGAFISAVNAFDFTPAVRWRAA